MSGKTDPLSELNRIAIRLNPGQIHLLCEMAGAMNAKIEQKIMLNDILNGAFIENFSNRLLIHHAFTAEKLNKKTFEYAFCAASQAAGKNARLNPDATNPAEDVTVEGMKFSLKTEASRRICQTRITISKLMEARWIRDANTAEKIAKGVQDKVVGHLKKYQRMLILRAFNIREERTRYDLVEIPLQVLLAMKNLTAKDFTPRTTTGTSSAYVCLNQRQAFKLILDGAVEKITIRHLDYGDCKLHGYWIIPNRLTQ